MFKQPYILIPIFIPVLTIFWFILRHTEFGTHIYAIGGNSEVARIIGINVKKNQILGFCNQWVFMWFFCLIFYGI
ncbi:MAG TPA: hypothetical protein ENG39_02295 [Candidatus Omnitrophica bacterium]|nr:hypothetical protein [Candidatus Omnitrophota bacterium]